MAQIIVVVKQPLMMQRRIDTSMTSCALVFRVLIFDDICLKVFTPENSLELNMAK